MVSNTSHPFPSDELLKSIQRKNVSSSLNQIKRMLGNMPSSEIAHSLESLPPKERKLLWSMIEIEDEGEIIAELNDEIQQELMAEISTEELIKIIEDLELDEIVDILQALPESRTQNILSAMSERDQKRIKEALEYPEDSAGGLMNTDIISVRPKHSIEVVMRYLRAQKKLPQNTDQIFVVSRENKYIGSLPVSSILVSEPSLNTRELMETEMQPLDANLADKDVARLFEQNDWVSAPVVDENLNLIGRITIDDVVDVILEDADLEAAVTRGVMHMYNNTGQSCNAPSRMLVPRTLLQQAEQIAEKVSEAVVMGPTSADTTTMGPVISKLQWDKIQGLIEAGIAEGAKVVCGGPGLPEGIERGYYVRPTVFSEVSNDMTVAQQEIFGPVLVMIPYDSEEEAIRIANDTPYGLAGYVQSGDLDHARRIASRIRAGNVHINGASGGFDVPFGGYKQSGNGREWGAHGFTDYLEIKAIEGYDAA